MKQAKLWMLAATLTICGMTMVSCFSRSKKSTVDVPAAPDYQDSTQWYITNRQATAVSYVFQYQLSAVEVLGYQFKDFFRILLDILTQRHVIEGAQLGDDAVDHGR